MVGGSSYLCYPPLFLPGGTWGAFLGPGGQVVGRRPFSSFPRCWCALFDVSGGVPRARRSRGGRFGLSLDCTTVCFWGGDPGPGGEVAGGSCYLSALVWVFQGHISGPAVKWRAAFLTFLGPRCLCHVSGGSTGALPVRLPLCVVCACAVLCMCFRGVQVCWLKPRRGVTCNAPATPPAV